ncbi:hypothetical protein ABKV19_012078 [Rosa sericea]
MIKVSQFCVAYGPYVSMGFSILCKGKDPTPSVVPPSIKIQIPDLPKRRSVSRSHIINRHSRKKLFHELLQEFLFKLPKLPEFEVSMSDFLLLVDLGLFLYTIYSAYHYTPPAPEVQPGVVAPDAPHPPPPPPPPSVALNNGAQGIEGAQGAPHGNQGAPHDNQGAQANQGYFHCESHIDRNDPNHDSGEEKYLLSGAHGGEFQLEAVKVSDVDEKLRQYQNEIVSIIHKYLLSDDILKLIQSLGDLAVPEYNPIFLKKLITLAVDGKNLGKEMASVLLSALHIEIFSTEDIVDGFVLLLESAQDTELDILDASNELALFLARAVIDDVLAPQNLEEICSRLPPNCSATETVQMAQSLVSVHHAGEYMRQYKSIIQEYFFSDDIPVLIQSLKDLAVPEHNPIFVKKLIILAMDGKSHEKEMASVLLSSLHIEIFSTEDIVNGFVLLLEYAEDSELGILDASNECALYLARAVVDDVLSPLKLEEIGSRLPPNCSATVTVRMAQSLISARHAGDRLLNCWGVGTGWAVEDTKDNITKLLDQYESGGVVAEACQCIRDIGMPFFNHEVVKKALVLAMEKNGTMLDLLQECFSEGLITVNQMTKGFSRIKDKLDDLALDIPTASEKFSFYVEHAQEKGWVLPTFGSSAADCSH